MNRTEIDFLAKKIKPLVRFYGIAFTIKPIDNHDVSYIWDPKIRFPILFKK